MQTWSAIVWLLPVGLAVAMFWLVDTVRRRGEGPVRLPVAVLDGTEPYPLTVVRAGAADQRVVRRPERIVIGNAALVDFVVELVEPSRVVALPEQALTWSRLVEIDGGFREKATLRALDAEGILARDADLVLCSSYNAVLGGPKLADAGIPVISLPHPTGLDDVRAILALLGRVLGVEAQAARVDEDIARRVAALRARAGTGDAARRGAIVYSNVGGGGWSAGSRTLTDDMIRLAGLHNVTAEFGRGESPRFSFEDILACDPDVIVVPAAFGEQVADTRGLLLGTAALTSVAAVRNGGIIELHPRLFSTGSQEVVSAAEQIAAALERRERQPR